MEWNRQLKFGPNQFQSCQKIFTTFLFTKSIAPWKMHLACTNGAKQHHLYVWIKESNTWSCGCWMWNIVDRKTLSSWFYTVELGVLESVKSIDIYIDIPGYKCPTMITGENQRPDLIVILNNKLYLLELTAGYETNTYLNSKRTKENYRALMNNLVHLYNSTQFINLPVYGSSRCLCWNIYQFGKIFKWFRYK